MARFGTRQRIWNLAGRWRNTCAVLAVGLLLSPVAEADPLLMFGDGAAGGIKIGENESPRPTDRIFLDYDYFQDVPLSGAPTHRETLGFEMTILGGRASLGARLPFIQFPFATGLGDLSLILKFTAFDRPESGTFLSAGLMVTVPTNTFTTAWPVVEPFVGWELRRGQTFVHGFHSVTEIVGIPGNNSFFNDIGVGRIVERDGALLQSVVPSGELHINSTLGFGTTANLTLATTLNFRGGASLAVGATVPVHDPSPSIALSATFNIGFGPR